MSTYESIVLSSNPTVDGLSSATRIPPSKVILAELDGLRDFACILVLIGHFNLWVQYDSALIGNLKEFIPAQLGVIIFFFLSLFLITNLFIMVLSQSVFHK